MADLKQAAADAIDNLADELNQISLDVWSHPEVNFQETYAHSAITNFLEKNGFPVERHYILDTGFRSVFGSTDHGPHVAILCEYDALPNIGHACGHNLINEVGLAAGIGVKAAFEANGQPLGKVTILGTPAEEGGGGKIDMINANVFKDVDVAMMAHPSPHNIEAMESLAIDRVSVFYHGKAVHASFSPWEGVNALDAAILCYQNVSCLRQQFKPSWRVHGVIRNGGVKPNIIPELAEVEFYARAPLRAELETLKTKLIHCFEAAAQSTGCTLSRFRRLCKYNRTSLKRPLTLRMRNNSVEIKWHGKVYYDMVNNKTACGLYYDNAVKLGVVFDREANDLNKAAGSTDMGNVSYEVPSIHPCFHIGTNADCHTRDFAIAAGDTKAQSYTLATGKALAMTAIDILTRKDAVQNIKDEFKASIQAKLNG